MDKDKALERWRGSAYKGINGKLLQDKVGEDVARKYLGTSKIPSNVNEIIEALRDAMKKIEPLGPYYRGCSKRFEKNCHLETFVSISKNKEDAESFVDKGGNVYSVTLVNGVKGVNTGVEGEILLEDGCYWEFHGNNLVTIHPPSADKGYEWCSAVKETPANPVVMCHSLTLTPEEEAEIEELMRGSSKRRKTRRYKMPRRTTRKYCKKTPCRKMGFTSCRPWKNCYKKQFLV